MTAISPIFVYLSLIHAVVNHHTFVISWLAPAWLINFMLPQVLVWHDMLAAVSFNHEP
jgi:hypothetical protein